MADTEGATDAPVSDEVGTRLLFENDRVRVWDLRLAPGERTGLHRHTEDYLYVVIGAGRLKAIRPVEGGQDSPGNETEAWYESDFADGEVRFRTLDGEDVHDAENVGDAEWRNIVVELKR